MTPYYSQDGITIYHGDCREVLPALEPEPLAVVSDPPYGMNYDTDSRRFSGGANGAERYGQGRSERPIKGDDEPFDPSLFLQFPHVVLWGFHHFAQRVPVGTVLVWLKKREHRYGAFLSDAELAWQKGGHGVYVRFIPGDGRWDLAEGNPRCHPAQKPVALMNWCIQRIPDDGIAILDPFMGSGTTLRAAKDTGRRAIGIEIEERYCEIAANRLAQGVLFGP